MAQRRTELRTVRRSQLQEGDDRLRRREIQALVEHALLTARFMGTAIFSREMNLAVSTAIPA
jgi:hypothetical protein